MPPPQQGLGTMGEEEAERMQELKNGEVYCECFLLDTTWLSDSWAHGCSSNLYKNQAIPNPSMDGVALLVLLPMEELLSVG